MWRLGFVLHQCNPLFYWWMYSNFEWTVTSSKIYQIWRNLFIAFPRIASSVSWRTAMFSLCEQSASGRGLIYSICIYIYIYMFFNSFCSGNFRCQWPGISCRPHWPNCAKVKHGTPARCLLHMLVQLFSRVRTRKQCVASCVWLFCESLSLLVDCHRQQQQHEHTIVLQISWIHIAVYPAAQFPARSVRNWCCSRTLWSWKV